MAKTLLRRVLPFSSTGHGASLFTIRRWVRGHRISFSYYACCNSAYERNPCDSVVLEPHTSRAAFSVHFLLIKEEETRQQMPLLSNRDQLTLLIGKGKKT